MVVWRWLIAGLRAWTPWAWLLFLLVSYGLDQQLEDYEVRLVGLGARGYGSFCVSLLLAMACWWLASAAVMASLFADLRMRALLLPQSKIAASTQPGALQARRFLALVSPRALGLLFALMVALTTGAAWILALAKQTPELRWISLGIFYGGSVTLLAVWVACAFVTAYQLLAHVWRQCRPPPRLAPAPPLLGPLLSLAVCLAIAVPASQMTPGLLRWPDEALLPLGLQLLSVIAMSVFVGSAKKAWVPYWPAIANRLWPSAVDTEVESSMLQ
jgi:hypothetical protein